jgi:hypothetical protein
MATKAELQKQLATIEAGLLDFTAVGEQAYFKQTGKTKLATKAVPRYTDVYNTEFEKVKDIDFTIAGDPTTAKTTDKAFYVFNAARTAEQKAQQQISSVEQNNLAVIEQQKDIQRFLSGERETAKTAVLGSYLSEIMNPVVPRGGLNPFEYETIDINTPQGWNKWKNTPRNMQYARRITDAQGRSTNLFEYRIKLTPAQIAEKRKVTETIERTRFMSSPTLQKTYAEKYRQNLLAQLKKIK